MTELVRPDVRFRESWAEAVTEFGDEACTGRGCGTSTHWT